MSDSTSATSTTLARKLRRMPASSVPAVAEAVDRIDRPELLVDGLKLAPDALDVRRDGRVVDDDVRVAHQLLPVLDVARKARERMHQPELGQREVHGVSAPRGLEALHIESERHTLQHVLRRRRLREQVGAPEERAD